MAWQSHHVACGSTRGPLLFRQKETRREPLRPPLVNPMASSALLVSSFCALTTGLLALQRHYRLHPELVRKLVHIGMGLATLSLPWLFASAWSVVVLTGAFLLL